MPLIRWWICPCFPPFPLDTRSIMQQPFSVSSLCLSVCMPTSIPFPNVSKRAKQYNWTLASACLPWGWKNLSSRNVQTNNCELKGWKFDDWTCFWNQMIFEGKLFLHKLWTSQQKLLALDEQKKQLHLGRRRTLIRIKFDFGDRKFWPETAIVKYENSGDWDSNVFYIFFPALIFLWNMIPTIARGSNCTGQFVTNNRWWYKITSGHRGMLSAILEIRKVCYGLDWNEDERWAERWWDSWVISDTCLRFTRNDNVLSFLFLDGESHLSRQGNSALQPPSLSTIPYPIRSSSLQLCSLLLSFIALPTLWYHVDTSSSRGKRFHVQTLRCFPSSFTPFISGIVYVSH